MDGEVVEEGTVRGAGAAPVERGASLPTMDWPNGVGTARPDAAGPEPQASTDDVGAGELDAGEYRGLLRSAEELLDAVDRALVQLDDGTYGACAVCGEPIEEGRLEADPTVTRCARHDAPGSDVPGSWPALPAGA